jgi:hypothetical protein
MTLRTFQRGVHAGQSKAGELQVIEFHAEPGVHVMALLAGGREPGAGVAGAGGLLEVLGVAGITLGRHGGVVAQSAILVAGITIQGGVRTHQRKAVIVVLNGPYGNIPAIDTVALFAARAHLATMNIGVALGALSSHIRKYWFGMALGTHHALVHAAQGKLGLVVIEFGNAADRFPSQRRMAIGAKHVQRSVRASGLGITLRLPRQEDVGWKEHKQHVDQNGRNHAYPIPNFDCSYNCRNKRESNLSKQFNHEWRLVGSIPEQFAIREK